MAYRDTATLGDIATDIAAGLSRLRDVATGIQNGGDALASQIQNASDYAVRLSNAATGAAAGAKAGFSAPATNTGLAGLSLTTVGLIAGAAYLLTRGRRR